MSCFACKLFGVAVPLWGIAAQLSLGSGAAAQVVIWEPFDASENGWTFYNDAGAFRWESLDGNPGGCLVASDIGDGRYWGFSAGPVMLGDKACWYGGELSWEVRTTAVDNTGNSQPDVVIEAGTGSVLVFDLPNPSPNVWVPYSVLLRETAGWKKNTLSGPAPSQSEFRAALASITALKFRGEFRSGVDTGRLDNVRLSRTAPAVAPQMSVACPQSTIMMTVATMADAEPVTYDWQIESVPGTWVSLSQVPTHLPCGAIASAVPADAPTVVVGITSCSSDPMTARQHPIRCLVTSNCGTIASTRSVYTVCAADINCSGDVSVQDIFDFLASFFGADPRADFNDSGVISVQDIFDFLAAYFAGCG